MATYSVQRPPFQVTRLRRSVFIVPAILGLLLLGGLFWLLASPKAREEVSEDSGCRELAGLAEASDGLSADETGDSAGHRGA